jgi:hypothetical protein
MIDAQRLAQTKIDARLSIAPVGNVVGDVAGLLGESLLELLSMFYPMRVCKKANVVVTELVTNVLENVSDQESGILLELCIDQERLVVGVTNRATAAQYEAVRARLQEIAQAPNAKHLLRDTIRSRRADRLKGGLGLMRLAVENRFGLAASYDQGNLMVKAEFALKGLA